ncbi:MAG: DUF4430 domain-containing protein [Lysinibacillus sp.]
MDFWKKWLRLALALVLALSLLTPATVNAEQEEVLEEQEGQFDVQFAVDGITGPIIAQKTIKTNEGTNVLDTLKQLLDQENLSYEIVDSEYGPYIQAINDIKANSLGGWDGWMYTVNGQTLDVGMASYQLKPTDTVHVYYGKIPDFSVTVNERIATVTLKGDVFTGGATTVRNWVVPAALKVSSVKKISDQEVELLLSGEAGTYEVEVNEKVLSSGQKKTFPIELTDSAVQKVNNLIAATNSEASEVNDLALKTARAAFDALTDVQKTQVFNSAQLVSRENSFIKNVLPKSISSDTSNRIYVSPKYSVGVKEYTLNVPTEFKTIDLQASTTHEDVKVTYAIGDTTYEEGKSIPVSDNKTITITTKVNDFEQKVNLKIKTLKPVTMKVDFRVEGVAGTTVNVKDFEIKGDGTINAAQATKQILDAHKISYKYSDSTGYFSTIGADAEKGLGTGSGWMYKVNGSYPNVYAPDITIKNGDEIVFDYINSFSVIENMDLSIYGLDEVLYSGAEAVDKITFNPNIEMPTAVTEGTDVKIKVTGKYNTVSYDYRPISGPDNVDLADVTIEYNGNKYVTDAKGEVTIPAKDIVEGNHELRFTKDLPGTIFTDDGPKDLNSYPRIIRTYKSLLVTPKDLAAESRQKAEAALKLGASYLQANRDTVSLRVNESHSAFWMLTAMKAANVNVDTFDWTTPPTVDGTFFTTPLEASQNDSNKLAGTIIAAKALGLDPLTVKGRDQVADLLAMQKVNGLFSTIWGEAFALIALELADAEYEQKKHIEAILALQNKTTGYFGDNDATGWTLFALSAFKDDPAVKAAIDKAVTAVHANYQAKGFTDNSNSMAAIISGLGAVGEDLFSAKWTYKDGDDYVNIVGHLVDNYMLEDGGVLYKASQTNSNLMALEQVYIALADALNGKSTFYTVADNADTPNPTPTQPEQEHPSTGGGSTVTPPTTEEPKQPETKPEQPGTGGGETVPPVVTENKVTMSITVSASEIVLPSEQFDIVADETAFDLLKRVTQEKNIALNARKTSMGMYVAGIAGVNEFDRGKLSGWMFSVNGAFPEVSADVYKLKTGDVVSWIYTADLGEDVGGSTGSGSTVIPPTTEEPKQPETKPEQPEIKPEQPETKPEQPEIKPEQPETKPEQPEVKPEQPAEISTTELTAADLADKKEITVTTPKGIALTIPVENATIAADEKLTVKVEEQEGKITFAIQVVNEKGEAKPFTLSSGYAKLTFSINATNEVAVANGKVQATPIAAGNGEIVILKEGNGELKAVPHIIVDGKATVFTKTGGTFVTSTEQVTFNDIANLSNKDEVTYLANRYVIKGSNGNFMPQSKITRGQFAMMIARALDLQAVGENPFTDTVGKEYEQAITALFEAGITTGQTATTFNPKGYVTRQQAAAFMARVLAYVEKKPAVTSEVTYKDSAQINATFKQDIALLAQLNIMSGKPDGSFNPRGSLTRAQMAKILKRTLNKAGLM